MRLLVIFGTMNLVMPNAKKSIRAMEKLKAQISNLKIGVMNVKDNTGRQCTPNILSR